MHLPEGGAFGRSASALEVVEDVSQTAVSESEFSSRGASPPEYARGAPGPRVLELTRGTPGKKIRHDEQLADLMNSPLELEDRRLDAQRIQLRNRRDALLTVRWARHPRSEGDNVAEK
jgi:hypothetical protein